MALTKIQAAGLTADLIDETKLADDSIDSEHYNAASIDNEHLADDAVGIAELSATGTASSSTFLRGDNTWATPTDTNTQLSTEEVQDIVGAMFTGNTETNITATYQDGDGTIDLVSTDTVYTHPNHSGEVTSTADGATEIADDVVDEANLKISNAGSNGQYLQKQSGNTGGLTWADVSAGVTSDAQRNTVAGTNAGDSFDGTGATDSTLYGYDAGTAITTGDHNTFIGSYAGDACNTGAENTAVGRSALSTCTSGNSNVAIGKEALEALETGQANTAVGWGAGHAHTTASNNVYVGQQAGYNNTDGNHSVYIGQTCGYAITTGDRNIAIGALTFKETGVDANDNIVIGYDAGRKITDDNNVIIGTNAHVWGTSCNNNVAIGYDAMKGSSGNTTGDDNVYVGRAAGLANTTGYRNVGVGYGAMDSVTTGYTSVGIGYDALGGMTTGEANVAVGYQAGNNITTGHNNVHLGRGTVASAVGVTYEYVIGSDGFTGKGTNTFYSGGTPYNQGNSSSWSTTSDRRIKKNIVDNNDGLSKINSIRVRNFEYRKKDEIDYTEFNEGVNPSAIGVTDKDGVQLGVIAQEIQENLPDVVTTASTGQLTVDPSNVTWYLVNAVKELSAKVTELEAKLNG